MKRKVITTLFIVVLLALTIQCSFFFGFTGKLGLIYLPKYVKSDIKDDKYVNPQKISSLSIYGYNSYMQIRNSLKYCDNITDFGLDLGKGDSYKTVENIDFLGCFPNVRSVYITGNSKDWSGISECNNLRELDITKSNYSDLYYLKNLQNLEWLEIQTCNEISSLEKVNLPSLKDIIIDAPSVDISCFYNAKSVTSLVLRVEKIKYIDSLKDFSGLKSIRFVGTYIDLDIVNLISNLDYIDSIEFSKCTFSHSQSDINYALSNYFERKADVKINDCEFRE